MPKDTPSMAKNKIRRSLLAILDPHPSKAEIEELWSYFGRSCAYCGVAIERGSRTGHLDHVIASTAGGSNGIHNCVLSCGRCNGDEKREEDWRTFLDRKAGGAEVAMTRAKLIEEWLSCVPVAVINPEAERQVQAIIAEAISHYEHAVTRMRALRQIDA
jgi:hypothetical protein